MGMPANWRGNLSGPSATGSPQRPASNQTRPTAAERSFFLLPQQPQPVEVAETLEHLTGRPADPAEVAQMMDDLTVTYRDYAPGGEVGQSGGGGTQVR